MNRGHDRIVWGVALASTILGGSPDAMPAAPPAEAVRTGG